MDNGPRLTIASSANSSIIDSAEPQQFQQCHVGLGLVTVMTVGPSPSPISSNSDRDINFKFKSGLKVLASYRAQCHDVRCQLPRHWPESSDQARRSSVLSI